LPNYQDRALSAFDVLIIGAGPSGLAAAKAAIEEGLSPIIIERSGMLGGIWRITNGYTWEGMRTNLSRHTCMFSDFPWPVDADIFPTQRAVCDYLKGYASEFSLETYIQYNTRVESVSSQEKGWCITVCCNGDRKRLFAKFVIVSTGFFSRPLYPLIPGIDIFSGKISHSTSFNPNQYHNTQRIVVVGGAYSGCEIAVALAEIGAHVTHIIRHPMWILSRYIKAASGTLIPIDLLFYSREKHATGKLLSESDLNRKKARYLEDIFGNPGNSDKQLYIDTNAPTPVYAAVSDGYLDAVKYGRILIKKATPVCANRWGLEVSTGDSIKCDVIIFATGIGPALNFLDPGDRASIEFVPDDPLQPLILYNGVFHPSLKNLAFIGMYRGPYFAILELQARWALGVFSGSITAPDLDEISAGLAKSRSIRYKRPRPQFPHGDYVGFADELASLAGVMPDLSTDQDIYNRLWSGPLIPSHFRLNGRHANKALAEQIIKNVPCY
jgi:dimethylaniline monooxygenase (N-oxide forming)